MVLYIHNRSGYGQSVDLPAWETLNKSLRLLVGPLLTNYGVRMAFREAEPEQPFSDSRTVVRQNEHVVF